MGDCAIIRIRKAPRRSIRAALSVYQTGKIPLHTFIRPKHTRLSDPKRIGSYCDQAEHMIDTNGSLHQHERVEPAASMPLKIGQTDGFEFRSPHPRVIAISVDISDKLDFLDKSRDAANSGSCKAIPLELLYLGHTSTRLLV